MAKAMQTPQDGQSCDVSGIELAKWFKYYRQYVSSYVVNALPFEKIRANGLYLKNKKQFDSLAKFLSKHKLDASKYIHFLVADQKTNEANARSGLLSIMNLKAYVEKLKIEQIRIKRYKYFMKSVKNIAEECAKTGCKTTAEYFKHLVHEKKLSAYYLSGKISKYYLASLPDFPKLVEKLDSMSQDEFAPLCHKFEKYSIDIKEALKQKLNRVPSTIKLTDAAIQKKQNLNIENNK